MRKVPITVFCCFFVGILLLCRCSPVKTVTLIGFRTTYVEDFTGDGRLDTLILENSSELEKKLFFIDKGRALLFCNVEFEQFAGERLYIQPGNGFMRLLVYSKSFIPDYYFVDIKPEMDDPKVIGLGRISTDPSSDQEACYLSINENLSYFLTRCRNNEKSFCLNIRKVGVQSDPDKWKCGG